MIEAALFIALVITWVVMIFRNSHVCTVIDGLCAQLADLQEAHDQKENPHAL